MEEGESSNQSGGDEEEEKKGRKEEEKGSEGECEPVDAREEMESSDQLCDTEVKDNCKDALDHRDNCNNGLDTCDNCDKCENCDKCDNELEEEEASCCEEENFTRRDVSVQVLCEP